MTILKQGAYENPFLGNSVSYIGGLDPLGLQATSEATFAFLLPGITNLTSRIRYYGFYCWLLKLYQYNIGDTNPEKHYNFIRRGEFCLALAMREHQKDYLQVSGSKWASDLLEQGAPFDLVKNADIHKQDKNYWSFSAGAFGQYYLGAMKAIGLVAERAQKERLFFCTNDPDEATDGIRLAEVFSKQLEPDFENYFLEVIESGQASLQHLERIYKNLGLDKVKPEGTEWQYYIDLMLGADVVAHNSEPQFNRRETIKLLCGFLQNYEKEGFTWPDFVKAFYEKGKVTEESDEVSFAWYFYYLNELWAFASTAVFQAVCCKLESSAYFRNHYRVFIDNFVNELLEVFEVEHHAGLKDGTVSDILAVIREEEELELLEELELAIKKKERPKQVFFAIKLILKVYENNKYHAEKLNSFGTMKEINRDGNVFGFFTLLDKNSEQLFREFCFGFIYKNIIARHIFVAFRKMGSSTKSTLKFTFEEGYLTQIGNFTPSFTGPRLRSLLYMLEDLQLINSNNQITDLAKQTIFEAP